MKLLGVDIGGTKTAVCVGDETGRILVSRRMESRTPEGPGRWFQRVCALADEVLATAGWTRRDLDAVGLSAPGPLSVQRGMLLAPPNMIGWLDVPVVEMFRREFPASVRMNNDANACGWAEYLWGARRGTPDLVYLTLSTGIGGGVVTGGRLLQGADDLGGEVGHHTLDANGLDCPCGRRGCWEMYCGGLNVANQLRAKIAAGGLRTAILDEAGGDPARIDFRCLTNAVRKGDAFARREWDAFVERLAQGIGTVLMFYNPRVVILGTIAIHNADLLMAPLRAALPRYAWPCTLANAVVEPSALEGRIGDLSALAVANG